MRRFLSGFVSVALAVAVLVSVGAPAAAEGSGAVEGDSRLTASAVATGESHSCVIVSNGRVSCWGSDANGQLGNGEIETGDRAFPAAAVVLPSGTFATALTAGDAHTCALLNTKEVSCWGSDAEGQLGNGDATSGDVATPSDPVSLPSSAGAVAISAGGSHTCAILTTGQLTCWGADQSGQLGNGPLGPLAEPAGRIAFDPGVTATAVAAGASHTCALLSTGAVSCWGDDAAGQLGNGAVNSADRPGGPVDLPGGETATALTAGDAHTCAVLADSSVSCWGSNGNGQLGNGSTTDLNAPSAPISLSDGAIAVAAGTSSTCAVSTIGQLSCWGSDASGQLGNGSGSTTDALSPGPALALPLGVPAIAVDVAVAHVCAVQVGGALTCWGDDAAGQLGNGTFGALDAPSPSVNLGIVLPGGASASALASARNHSCVLLSTGDVSCWGGDADGQLGNGTVAGTISAPPLPVLLPGGSTALSIATGQGHSCAVLSDGGVSCWGRNSRGQLGVGDLNNLDSPSDPIALPGGAKAEAIAAGASFTCALLEGGSVTCWGSDFGGPLGNGAPSGDVLSPPTPISLPGSGEAIQISAGVAHACALLTGGDVTCWGLGGFGQLGDGAESNRNTPSSPLPFPNGFTPAAVTTGSFHSCAISTANRVTCWGFNINGQLGDGTTDNISVPLFLVPFPGNANVVSLSSGDRHNCAVLADTNEVSCWGLATSGQLGNGDTTGNITTPTAPIDLPDGLTVQAVSAGGAATCSILQSGQLACWGADNQGQVGNGDPLLNEPLPVLSGRREVVEPQAVGQLPRPMPLMLPVTALTGTAKGIETVVDPISTATGNLTDAWTDLAEDAFGMNLVRSYNGLSDLTSALGDRWGIATGPQLIDGDGVVELLLPDGSRFSYEEDAPGAYRMPTQIAGELLLDDAATSGDGDLPMLRVEYANGSIDRFDTTGRLIEQRAWDGQTAVSAYNSAGFVETVTASTGVNFAFAYTGGQLDSVTSSTGRSVTYGYDVNDRLASITDEFGGITTITYTAEGWLQTLADPTGVVLEDNTYDNQGRVTAQTQPTGAVISLDYVGDGSTIVTDSSTGESVTYLHDETGKVIAIIDPFGEAVQRLYDANGNLVESLSRSGRYATTIYDDSYNILSTTAPDGSATSYTYDDLNRVLTITDPFGALTTYTYDGTERIASSVTDPLGHVSTSVVEDGLIMSTTDADGVTTTFTYDSDRRRTATTDELGNATTDEYDSAGRVISTSTPEGRVTQTSYGPDGRVESTTAPDGGVTSFAYDSAGRLLTLTDPAGAVLTNTYDNNGNLVSVTDAVGVTTSYEFDSSGRRTATVNSANERFETAYDALGRAVSTLTPLGDATTSTYDVEGQRLSGTVGSTGATSLSSYDDLGRVTSTTDAAGRQATQTYDARGRVISTIEPGDVTTTYEYDPLDRIVAMVDARGGTTTLSYTPAGRLSTVTDAAGLVTEYAYDDAGRQRQVTLPGGGVVATDLNGDGQPVVTTSPGGLTTSFSYDDAGRTKTKTDPSGVTTSWTYTARGEVATEKIGDQGTTVYVYNADGTLKSVSDPLGNTTSFTYDDSKNLVARTDALGAVESWTYNEANQIITATDALGRVTTATYNAAGQLTATTDPAGRSSTITYNPDGTPASTTMSQDASTLSTTYTYDNAGRIATVEDDTSSVTYSYNEAGDLLERATSAGQSTSYEYDVAGRKTTLQYPDGSQVRYSYNADGYLAEISQVDLTDPSSSTPVSTLTYNADGQVIEELLVDGSRTRTYIDGLLTNFDQTLPGANLTATLAYDSTGRVASETIQKDPVGDNNSGDGGGDPTPQPDVDPLICNGLAATIVGTNGDDILNGTSQNDVIVGLGGNDTITGASGSDTICGGDGDDTINGQSQSDTIFGGPGSDTISGDSGADVIDGGPGNDTITGNSQDDTIQGGDGDDDINGNSGADTLDGGNGTDIVDGSWQNDTCDDAETAPGCETITFNGEPDNPTTNPPNLPYECNGLVATIVGTNGDDVLAGTWQNDVIVGLGGNDTITGASGSDTICGGDGDDTINGQSQSDTIFGGPGSDTISGDSGADVIDGGPGNDTITGNSQDDTIQGGDGDDDINGNSGADTLDGGNGTDIVDGSWQNDTCDDAETAINCETETNNGESDPDPNDETVVVTYTYDDASQLVAESIADGAATTWTYDVVGRRSTEQVGATTTTYSYDTAGQLCWTAPTTGSDQIDCAAPPSDATTFAWDESGRLISESEDVTNNVEYDYDLLGRLAQTVRAENSTITTQTRTYSPDGLLASVGTQEGTSDIQTWTFAWDPLAGEVAQLATLTSPGSTSNLIYGPGGWSAATNTGGGFASIATDAHGSVIPSAGTSVARSDHYSAFGIAGGPDAFAPLLGYRGELTLDNQTYLRARNYQASIGQFTSQDLIEGVPGTTTLTSPYHYVNNNPLNLIDPTGLFTDGTYETSGTGESVYGGGPIFAVAGLDNSVITSLSPEQLRNLVYGPGAVGAVLYYKAILLAYAGAAGSALVAGVVSLGAATILLAAIAGIAIGCLIACKGWYDAVQAQKRAEENQRYTNNVVQQLVNDDIILPGEYGDEEFEQEPEPQLATDGANSGDGNDCPPIDGPIERHHTVPTEILNDYLDPAVANDGRVRGKRGAPNIWPLPKPLHRGLHEGPRGGVYNQAWIDALAELGRPATVDDVVRLRDEITEQFGIDVYKPPC